MKLNAPITIAFLLLLSIPTLAQTDSIENIARDYHIRASDYMKYDDYEKAIPNINWLLKNVPLRSEAIQSWAIEAYEQVAEQSEGTRKAVLLDSMLYAYKSKKQYFGLSDIDKNKLAFRYFKYFQNDTEKLKEAYPFFKELFSTPDLPINNNLIPYMAITEKYNSKVQPLDQSEIMDVYMLTSERVANEYFSGNNKRYESYSSFLNASLRNIFNGEMPCSAIQRVSDGLTNPDSVLVAKKVLSENLNSGCGRTDGYTAALELLVRNEPSAGLYKILAQYAAVDKDYDQAIEYYEKAINLEGDAKKQADIHMDIASIHFINLNKPKSREHALKVIELDAEQSSTAYSFIGNLYLSSFDDCADRYDKVQDKAVYLVAYDMFALAKDAKGMEEAQLRFPTRTEAFDLNMDDGDQIDVGCWIQRKTKLRTIVSN